MVCCCCSRGTSYCDTYNSYTQHQRIHFKFDDFVMAHAFDVAFQDIRLPCAAAQRVDGRQSGMNGVPAWRAQSKSN